MARVEQLLQERSVVAEVRESGTDRGEADAGGFDVGAVLRRRGDDGIGSARLERARDGDVRVKIPERPDGRDQDAAA